MALMPTMDCSSGLVISHQYDWLSGETPTVTTDDDPYATALQLVEPVKYILG
jgi:hypothetical protein